MAAASPSSAARRFRLVGGGPRSETNPTSPWRARHPALVERSRSANPISTGEGRRGFVDDDPQRAVRVVIIFD
jgi:hypothetical protein